MKKTLTLSLIYFLLSGFIVKLHGQNTVKEHTLQNEVQIDSVFHGMIKDAENLAYTNLARGVDDSNHAGFISNEFFSLSFDSILTIAKSKAQGVKRQDITIQKEKITVLSDRIALLSAAGITKVEIESGNPFTVKFFWSFVFEKYNNTWKVIQSHQSTYR
jgi:hypothetical protein